jgi:hypothetical protein
LLGLAWPALTGGVFNGTNATKDGNGEPGHEKIHYSSFFATMVADGLVAPIFSLALGRNNSDASYIAFGGLPPINIHGSLTSTPMLLVS